jgi:hypothetical protein
VGLHKKQNIRRDLGIKMLVTNNMAIDRRSVPSFEYDIFFIQAKPDITSADSRQNTVATTGSLGPT